MTRFERSSELLILLVSFLALIFLGGLFQGASDPTDGLNGGATQETEDSKGPFGCTVVMTAKDDMVLVGNNEDRNFTETIVNFFPSTNKFYGRIVFGYTDAPYQGGMNDQGLVVDGNAVKSTGWIPDPQKESYNWGVMAALLATCATCEDVQEFFERYNTPGLDRARIPVADRSGASMIVEYSHGRVQFVRSDTWYQVATNFVISNFPDKQYPCWRYKTADSILSRARSLSIELIREVLAATHQEGRALTVYSNIYDVKAGTIRLYSMRNFDECVDLNLADELKKGERQVELRSLFVEGRR